MAAPIAHIFLAAQMLAGPLRGYFNEKEFIRGTSFPDIRYLKCVERAETHFDHVTFDEIRSQRDSFKAGMLFHSFVDEKREEYIVAHNLYDKIPKFKFTTQSLKFAEDKLLLSLFDSKKYVHYFDGLVEAEKFYNIPHKYIKIWHRFLQEYFAGSLSTYDVMMKYFDINEPQALKIKRWCFGWFFARKIDTTIEDILKDNGAKDILLRFYLNFAQIHKE
jgi:hypothetical protein